MARDQNQQLPLAIVTGASSGLGEAMARLLAQRGYRTLLLARRFDCLQKLAAELSTWAPSMPLRVDLADADSIIPTVAPALAEHGPVHALFNNAGCGQYRQFLSTDQHEQRRLLQVNYFAPSTLIRLVLPGMLSRGRGHVINISSIAATHGPWGHGAYASAKAALASLTQTLAVEYADQGVHFSCVKPGLVQTDFFRSACYEGMDRQLQRCLPPAMVAQKIVGLLKRPQLELYIPRHYRLLALLSALWPVMARRLVASESRPQEPPMPETTPALDKRI